MHTLYNFIKRIFNGLIDMDENSPFEQQKNKEIELLGDRLFLLTNKGKVFFLRKSELFCCL
jgi:hypothetical protein